MPSVMGLLEEWEAAARVRAEELRAEMERITAELADAEAVLERRMIARTELAEPRLLGANRRRHPLPVCRRCRPGARRPRLRLWGPSCRAGTRRRWARSR